MLQSSRVIYPDIWRRVNRIPVITPYNRIEFYCSCGWAILWLRQVTITIVVLEVVKQYKLCRNSGHIQMQINNSKYMTISDNLAHYYNK